MCNRLPDSHVFMYKLCMSKECHKKSEDKDRHSKCVIHGREFLHVFKMHQEEGNPSIPFDVVIDVLWVTKLGGVVRQLFATHS